MARIVAMRQERREGWSYDRIAQQHELSPERVAQLIEREPLKARVYGPWVVFNDIPFLVMCRPNKEAQRRSYMRRWRADRPPTQREEMTAYWRAMIVRYSEETGTVLVNKGDFR